MLKTQAIVIKEVNYRDNDKMLTLFSPEHGRIDVLSRGCRKSTAKLLAASQSFICGDFQINISKDKYYLAGCEIAHSFFDLRNDYKKLFTAQVFLEITSAFVLHEQSDQPLYFLLINALFALENAQNTPEYIMLFFLLKSAQAAGFAPNFSECPICGAKGTMVFSVESGGLICDQCRPGTLGRIKRIQTQELEEMIYILSSPTKAVREKREFSASKQLIQLMNEYLENKTDNRFKSYRTWLEIIKS
ncbi:MAG: DNA repair protein RecO [Eubacteriales bacterium]